jgi:hypothetical protein
MRKSNVSRNKGFSLLIDIVLVGTIWLACTQKSPLNPTQSVNENVPLLTNLDISPAQIVAGDSARIRVRLVDQNNNPMANKELIFSVNISQARFRDALVSTGSDGWATAWLLSDQNAQNATVTVRYGEFTSVSATVQFISSQTGSLQIKASPEAILASGTDMTTITVTLLGDSAKPVANAPITFTASAGTIIPSASTDSDGKVEVTLTSSASWDDVVSVVTAQYESDNVAISVLFRGVTLDVRANPNVILADGQSTSTIRAQLKESQRNVVIPNVSLRFQTDTGTLLNGEVRTNEEGVAEAVLVSGRTPDTAHVVVYFGPTLNRSVNVAFRESIAGFIKVTATPDAIIADRQTQSAIKARVTDANQFPIAGADVAFEFVDKPAEADWGTLNPEIGTTNLNGECSTTLTSSDLIGVVKVRAFSTVVTDTGDVVLADTAEIRYIPGDVHSIQLKAWKYDPDTDSYIEMDQVKADGIDQCKIRATVKDEIGHGLAGIPVQFSTTLGDITPTDDTDEQGMAEASFSSSIVGVAVVTAVVDIGGRRVSNTIYIRALPGDPNSIVLTFDPRAIGVKGTGQNQTATIQSEVRDARNNPVVDSTLVRFSIVHQPGGVTLSSYGNIPTVGGIARVSISSGTVSGNVRVRAEVIDPENGSVVLAEASEILVHAGPPYMEDKTQYHTTHLTVRAGEYNIWRALGTTDLSIAVFDKYHNPVQQNTAVYLTASGGGVSTHTAYTDEYGMASVILTGANPQPLIHKFYHGELMQDPNDSSIVLPGPVYFMDLDQYLLPNFEGDFPGNNPGTLNGIIPNSMDDSLDTCPRYIHDAELYRNLENDGVARIIAYTEGVDANGDSIRAWDQIAVVYSGSVDYSDDSYTVFNDPDQTLYLREARTVTFALMDDNGNPIESNSTISAELVPSEISAALSWETLNTGSGWGTVYYTITISNDIGADEEKPKTGWVVIQISWENEHQFGDATTASVYISALDRAQ